MKQLVLLCAFAFAMAPLSATAQTDCANIPDSAGPVGQFATCFTGSSPVVNAVGPMDMAIGWESQENGGSIATQILDGSASFTAIAAVSPSNDFVGGCAFAADPDALYCFDVSGNFMSFDKTTAARTDIGTGTFNGAESISGMAYDRANGIMYATSTDITTSSLYTVDLASGAVTSVGAMGTACNIALAYHDPSATFYGYDICDDTLHSVNTATGAATMIGAIGFDSNFGQGMECDRTDGTCYMFAFNAITFVAELRTVDLATGTTAFVATMNGPTCGLCQIAGADIDVNPILPVELVSFEAQVEGGRVTLGWSTASETNNAGFEVEEIIGETSVVKGFVNGSGTSANAHEYSFEIADVAPGTHRYRLRQIDFDGAFEYSGITEVVVEVPDAYVLNPVFPNPFNPTATFSFAVAEEQVVTVKLYDSMGRQVQTLYNQLTPADEMNEIRINGWNLSSGTYMVEVAGIGFRTARSVTLLK